MTGHCSKCGKVWTLDTTSGKCRWCGKQAACQTTTAKPRREHSRRRKRPERPVIGSYDQLPEPYLTYHKVASKFNHKAPAQDRGDLLHDIIIALADVARRKPLTEPAMYRIASITVMDYWRAHYKLTKGIDCGSCSKAQRRKCKEHWLYGECPKAIKLDYLSKPITDGEGNITELGELITDDHAIDLDAWLDAKTFTLACPQRLLLIANKLNNGETLTHAERVYLAKMRKRERQKNLF